MMYNDWLFVQRNLMFGIFFCCCCLLVKVLRVLEVYDATRRDNTISTVTELCTGSHLHSNVPYPEPRAKKIIHQILDALHYMHQRGLFHNSLTTENSKSFVKYSYNLIQMF
jgi:serine/threonine protein kinase